MIGNVERSVAVGVVRAGKDGVEPGSRARQLGNKRGLHRLKAFPVVEAPRDSGLVADQHHRNPKTVTSRDRVGGAGDHAHILRPAEIVRVFDHDAVTVEKQSRPAGKIFREDIVPASARLVARFEVAVEEVGNHCSIARSTRAQMACPATM